MCIVEFSRDLVKHKIALIILNHIGAGEVSRGDRPSDRGQTSPGLCWTAGEAAAQGLPGLSDCKRGEGRH